MLEPSGRWIFFPDTYNDYSILYDPPVALAYPQKIKQHIIDSSKEEFIISNYCSEIKAQIYSFEAGLSRTRKVDGFKMYYTKEVMFGILFQRILDNYPLV